MIKTITAYTNEMDDLELAAKEIADQLDYENNKRKNTLGILACNFEFVLSGAAKAVCESLPFEVIGSVTTAQAVNGGSGPMILTLMMLTSDDVEFSAVMSGTLVNEYEASLRSGYREAEAALSKPAALTLILAPYMIQNSGDAYVDILTEESGGVPCFGTMAVDDSTTFENSFMIYNGEHYRDRMAIALIGGDVNPKFYLATISEGKILDQPALITSSDNHILKEVNGRPLVEFFAKLGLTYASETSYAMTSLPFIVDYNDGTPAVSKVFIGLNEDEHGICAARMPEGSTLRIGVFDKADVLLTSEKAVAEALSGGEKTILMYSCVSRNMSLAGDMLAELDAVSGRIANGRQFMMAYSGGEFCPTRIDQNTAINRFHNNTFVLCAF